MCVFIYFQRVLRTMSSNVVINPLTSRPIKVGGAVWRRLVSDGLLEARAPEHELYKAESKEEALVAKKMLTKQNKDKTRSVKIRNDGRTVIKARKRLTQKEISEGMSKASSIVLQKIQNGQLSMPDDASEDEVHEYIQNQVLREIMNLSISAPAEVKPSGYAIETPAVSEDDEYTDDEGDYTE